MADQAAADSVTPYKEILAKTMGTAGVLGSIYAIDVAPERRSVTRVSGEPGNYKTERVTDFNEISKVLEEIRTYSAREAGVKTVGSPDEFAYTDPGENSYLIQAWQSVAMYFAVSDESDDKTAAMAIMQSISALLADADDTAAGNTFTCEYCDRNFASQDAAIKHLSNVHAAREQETKMKTERD